MRVLPGSDQRIIWVPPRQTLKHTLFTLPSQLGGRKRASALQLKIKAWSPFDETRFSVIWSDNIASVFAWDGEALDQRVIDKGYDPIDCEVIPEAFIRSPGSNGVRLVSCVDGVEAQVWEQGFLIASRWWTGVPPAHEWALFNRTAGKSANATLPDLVEPEWLETPWSGNQTHGTPFAQALKNERLVAVGAAILLAPCVYFGAQWLTYSMMALGVKRDIASIEVESRTTRVERAQALSALETAEDLVSLHRHPHQLEIFSKTHHLLRQHEVTLSSWDYDDGVLEFGLESNDDMDARIFISAFEGDPLFSSVSAGTRGSRLVLRMSVSAATGQAS
ncbi:MAG: hypothetical protein GKS03_06110 [Alphaproteobacteria bacterium]|nr:hypothetical protein [Alphaproteobacteria bacterium]